MRVPLLPAVICAIALVPVVQATELRSGDSIQNSLRPGATETYSLNLQAGDLVSLDFIDTGQDVMLTVLNPAGEAARRFSSKLQEEQSVAFFASQSGAWQIVVAGRNKESECGYKISG